MGQFPRAFQQPSRKNTMKSNLFGKKFHTNSTMNHMCGFENDWISPGITKWLHKISVLLGFVGRQGKKKPPDQERLACAQ